MAVEHEAPTPAAPGEARNELGSPDEVEPVGNERLAVYLRRSGLEDLDVGACRREPLTEVRLERGLLTRGVADRTGGCVEGDEGARQRDEVLAACGDGRNDLFLSLGEPHERDCNAAAAPVRGQRRGPLAFRSTPGENPEP